MAGPQHLPERPREGARLFPRNGWVVVSYPLAFPGCTLSISETSAPACFQLSHVPGKFFSLYKSSLSCACLPFPCLVLLAAGFPCSDSPCLQSPCEGETLWSALASLWFPGALLAQKSSLVSQATHSCELRHKGNSQLGTVTF